jgi:hypothetical protein
VPRNNLVRGFCGVEECGRPHKSGGFCNTHYIQFRRGVRSFKAIKTRDSNPPELCTEIGCRGQTKARGLCDMHYARLLRYGHTKYRDRKRPPKICSIEGCDNWVYAKNKCSKHYVHLRKLKIYGLSVEDYDSLLNKQNGVCAICEQKETVLDGVSGKVKMLSVDHCHDTGKVRGLLCSACNTGIGLARHDPEILRSAISYLAAYGIQG